MQQHAQAVVDEQRLRGVAAPLQRLHQNPIAVLAVGRQLDEPPAALLGLGQRRAAEAETRCGEALEPAAGACRRGAAATRPATGGRDHAAADGWPRSRRRRTAPRPPPTRGGDVGPRAVQGLEGGLDVDEGVRAPARARSLIARSGGRGRRRCAASTAGRWSRWWSGGASSPQTAVSSSSRSIRRSRLSTRYARSSRPLAPGSASSTRRPSSRTTNRPQSWILARADHRAKVRQDRRKIRETTGRDDRSPTTKGAAMTARDASLYGSPEEAQKAPPRGPALPRLPARGHRRTGARLPGGGRRRGGPSHPARRRCRTSATSSTTSGGTAAARRATGRIAHI